MKKDFISIKQLNMQIANKLILRSINCDIEQGQKVAIVGINGSGKSTLLKLLCGILRPSSGKLQIANCGYQNLQENMQLRQMIGYAPDNPPLYAYDTVVSYLYFIAQLKKIPKSNIAQNIDHYLEVFDLTPFRKHYIHTLSKGTQQRINLAQALINNPQILILDEPTNSLDNVQSVNFMQHLKNLPTHVTIIVASHNYSEVIQLCDYMLKITDHMLEKVAPPQNINKVLNSYEYVNS